MSAASMKHERWSQLQDGFDRLQALLGSIGDNYQKMVVQVDSTTTGLNQMAENQKLMTKQLEATGQTLARLTSSWGLPASCMVIPPADKMLANCSTVYLNQSCDYTDNTHEGLLRQLALGVDDKNTKGSAHVLLDARCSQEVAQELFEEFSEVEFSDVIWDREISDELFSDTPLADVIWDEEQQPMAAVDEMPPDHAEQEGFDGLPCADVVWYDEQLPDQVADTSLLQQIVMGNGYSVGVIFSHADGHDADQMLDKASKKGMIELTQFSAVQLEFVNDSVHENATAFAKTQAVSVSDQRSIFMVPLVSEEVQVPLVGVSWDDMSTDPIVQEGLLQQLIHGTDKNMQCKQILLDAPIEFGKINQGGEDLTGNERKLTAEFSQQSAYSVDGERAHNFFVHDGWLASGIDDIVGKKGNEIVNIRTDGRGFSPWNKEAVYQEVSQHVGAKELCLIILVLIRPWDPGIASATAWGQAVFRGAGNVMTQVRPKMEPKFIEPSCCHSSAQEKPRSDI